ncbi:MAG: bifunctional 2-polyprenyl-6-hydroxyphenol methylase/3-demethylubiquinol 3-O-methyltransferase UbiG [Pseudomonadota bacterium]
MAANAGYTPNDLTIYDQVAEQWWSDEIPWVRTLKNMVAGRLRYFDGLAEWDGRDVLDLGCAGGFMAEALAERGATVSGIDPAADAIAAAKRHAAESGLKIDYTVGVGEALPYADGAFDIVVCVDVLEHVSDLAKVLDETARVLRPGGLFLFDTINRNPLASFAVVTLGERVLRLLPRGAHDPTLFIKPKELRAGLEAAGFTVGPFTGLGPRGLNRKLDFTFGRLPGTAIIYMGSARLP